MRRLDRTRAQSSGKPASCRIEIPKHDSVSAAGFTITGSPWLARWRNLMDNQIEWWLNADTTTPTGSRQWSHAIRPSPAAVNRIGISLVSLILANRGCTIAYR
jgi:hypothetical protein